MNVWMENENYLVKWYWGVWELRYKKDGIDVYWKLLK